MIRRLISLLVVIVGLCAPVFAAEPDTRERLSMDRGWLFHLGEVPFPLIAGHGPTYSNAKARQAWGAAAQGFDDSAWREVRLPHDWAVEGPFDQKENLSQGYRPRGIGWYRRHFKIPAADKGRHLTVTAPDPNQAVEDNDMNSWAPVDPGKLQPFPDGNFAVYRTKFQPGAVIRQNGGTLQMRRVTGKAEVWLDGKLLTKKDKQESADIKTAFPPGEGERTLSVLIETTATSPAGLNGSVTIDAKNP